MYVKSLIKYLLSGLKRLKHKSQRSLYQPVCYYLAFIIHWKSIMSRINSVIISCSPGALCVLTRSRSVGSMCWTSYKNSWTCLLSLGLWYLLQHVFNIQTISNLTGITGCDHLRQIKNLSSSRWWFKSIFVTLGGGSGCLDEYL